jgi:4-amino-4-deoxy-L-arabinose transferase-like glycosyltransferase
MRKIAVLLSAILILAFFLRCFEVSDYPKSLYWDEVSIGFNARAILQTGKDEWGKQMPLFFEAFNEYKFPVTIYLTALSIHFFGDNDFAVRFPSVAAGTASTLLIFFLTKNLLNLFFSKLAFSTRQKIALLAAFTMAISMWHLQFSRAEFEANIGLCFQLLTLVFLTKLIKQVRIISLLLFFVSLAIVVYSYSVQIPTMLLSSIILIFFAKKPSKEKFSLGLLVLIAFLIIEIPFLWHIKTDGFARFNQVSVFSQNDILKNIIDLRVKYGAGSKVLFNQYTAYVIIFLKNLFAHLNPWFLFPGGDGNPRHSAGSGLVYPFEFLLIAGGLIFLLRRGKRFFLCLLVLIIIGYVPASLTQDAPHALRSLNVLPFIVILIACGIELLRHRVSFKWLLLILYAGFTFTYLNRYYHTYAEASFATWGGENKLMVKTAKNYVHPSNTVFFTGAYWRPYIYYYYYFHAASLKVQAYNNSTRFGNIYFGYAGFDEEDRRYDYNFNFKSLVNKEKLLLFLSPDEKLQAEMFLKENNIMLIKNVYYNRRLIFSIYEKN